MNDLMLGPSFRGRTASSHVEDGIKAVFDRRLPDQWEARTTVYVVLEAGAEVSFKNESNKTPDIFDFHPTSWATLHANLVRLDDTTVRIDIIGSVKNPAVDLAPPGA